MIVPFLIARPGFSIADSTYPLALLLVGAVVFVAVGALSHEHERPYSPAIVYLVIGLVAAAVLRGLGLRHADPIADANVVGHVAELALIVSLFSAGLKVERELTWTGWREVALLLGGAMPLAIAAVAVFGVAAMGLGLGSAVVLGAVLAPTDPVLAGPVGVGPPGKDEEPTAQFLVSAEAGLNDGLASPFVLLGIFLATHHGLGWLGSWAWADVAYAVIVGVGIGAVGGRAVPALFGLMARHGLVERELDAWLAVPTAFVLYGAAEYAGGYGFLAAFAGGLAARRAQEDDEIIRRVHAAAGTVERFTELAVILPLGSMVSLAGLAAPGVAGWLLTPVLILIIRPAMVFACLARSETTLRERAFVAWFGVRGVAALYYATLVVELHGVPRTAQAPVVWTTLVCVMMSIVAHGVTATPLRRRLLGADGDG